LPWYAALARTCARRDICEATFMAHHKRRRVCILSAGGDAPGVNAIIRSFVHASHRLSVDVLACRYGFEGLLAMDGLAHLSIEDVHGILSKGGSVLGCSTKVNPFFVPRQDGTLEDRGEKVKDRLHAQGVEALVMIGGDGTLLAAERFSKVGLPCIVIQKTIDNDVAGSEITCGFESAVETVTHAIDSLHSTAEAHARVMILEVMGRTSGFIALHGGVAGGADVILLPELPYRVERIVEKIRERELLGRRYSIIVIAEGARPVGGDVAEVASATPGHLARLGGAGERLARSLEATGLSHEVRVTVLGHLQRGGSPAAADRVLGTEMGALAAELFVRRELDTRVVVRDGRVASMRLSPVQALHRHVDLNGALARAARLVGTELGDETPPSIVEQPPAERFV
jgi:6-phosphofructokinase